MYLRKKRAITLAIYDQIISEDCKIIKNVTAVEI